MNHEYLLTLDLPIQVFADVYPEKSKHLLKNYSTVIKSLKTACKVAGVSGVMTYTAGTDGYGYWTLEQIQLTSYDQAS